ncbi:MAG TPA: hypothetical protein VML55_15160 [Planctomycetaceae bacterium]|nr:hypothetical protein [Planctomycetaceae bacterium]
MSRILLTSAIVALAASAPAALKADGLIHQLPKDGAWALYDLKFAISRGGEQRELTGTLRVASVGKTVEDGKDARWIEFRLDFKLPDEGERTILSKVLVPDEHLQAGKSPVDHIIRGWLKEPEADQARRIEGDNLGPLPIFLGGPGKDHRKLDAETLKNEKLGEIEAAGAGGTIEYQEGNRQQAADYEVRTHEKAPFGVVTAKFTIRIQDEAEPVGRATLTLSDIGDTALSDLPDRK